MPVVAPLTKRDAHRLRVLLTGPVKMGFEGSATGRNALQGRFVG